MSKVFTFCGSVLVLAMLGSGFVSGQRTADQPTFRTGTSLVTVDAVVVDQSGRHVTDLTIDDFEVFERGTRQDLRQAVYVPMGAGAAPLVIGEGTGATGGMEPGAIPAVTPRRLGPDPIRARARASTRTIAVVVDDLGLSFESTAYVRRMLTKFVDEQVQEGDLVAIVRTAAGVGALQQFTTDKRLLHAAVDRVRWTVMSRSGIGAFSPIVPPDATGAAGNAGSGTAENTSDEDAEGLRTNMLAAGSLGALDYVVRGVEELPGRKTVVFVSEGFRLIDRMGLAWSAFTRVMDHANRAGVVVYTMDARGLVTGLLTAEDNPQPQTPPPGPGGAGGSLMQQAEDSVLEPIRARRAYLRDSQEGLVFMAEQTGGFAIVNNNDLNRGLARVLDDARGYYLLGFTSSAPAETRWDGGRISIRVKRPGLRVRARQGFFGPGDPERPRETSSRDPLVMAALSPFGAGAIDVRLTALFGHDPKHGSYMRSLFFIDPAGLTFEQVPDGRHSAQATLLVLTVGDNGQIAAQFQRRLDLVLSDEEHRSARQQGILYNLRVPMNAPGGYQVRAAVRDERSRAIGTSSQFFDVPAVGQRRVALSGVVMGATAARGEEPAAEGGVTLTQLSIGEGVFSEPGVRIFKPGSDALYTCEIYDGVSDAGTALTTFATLLRDGRAVFQTPETPVSRRTKGVLRTVPVAGRLSLGRTMPRGPYTLQVTVAEARNGRVRTRASQWVDFEVR